VLCDEKYPTLKKEGEVNLAKGEIDDLDISTSGLEVSCVLNVVNAYLSTAYTRNFTIFSFIYGLWTVLATICNCQSLNMRA
jgi:hypothetical protein